MYRWTAAGGVLDGWHGKDGHLWRDRARKKRLRDPSLASVEAQLGLWACAVATVSDAPPFTPRSHTILARSRAVLWSRRGGDNTRLLAALRSLNAAPVDGATASRLAEAAALFFAVDKRQRCLDLLGAAAAVAETTEMSSACAHLLAQVLICWGRFKEALKYYGTLLIYPPPSHWGGLQLEAALPPFAPLAAPECIALEMWLCSERRNDSAAAAAALDEAWETLLKVLSGCEDLTVCRSQTFEVGRMLLVAHAENCLLRGAEPTANGFAAARRQAQQGAAAAAGATASKAFLRTTMLSSPCHARDDRAAEASRRLWGDCGPPAFAKLLCASARTPSKGPPPASVSLQLRDDYLENASARRLGRQLWAKDPATWHGYGIRYLEVKSYALALEFLQTARSLLDATNSGSGSGGGGGGGGGGAASTGALSRSGRPPPVKTSTSVWSARIGICRAICLEGLGRTKEARQAALSALALVARAPPPPPPSEAAASVEEGTGSAAAAQELRTTAAAEPLVAEPDEERALRLWVTRLLVRRDSDAPLLQPERFLEATAKAESAAVLRIRKVLRQWADRRMRERYAHYNRAATVLARSWRECITRCMTHKWQCAILGVVMAERRRQAALMCRQDTYDAMNKRHLVAMKSLPTILARCRLTTRRAAAVLGAAVRLWQARARLTRRRKAVLTLQAVWRGVAARRSIRTGIAAALDVDLNIETLPDRQNSSSRDVAAAPSNGSTTCSLETHEQAAAIGVLDRHESEEADATAAANGDASGCVFRLSAMALRRLSSSEKVHWSAPAVAPRSALVAAFAEAPTLAITSPTFNDFGAVRLFGLLLPPLAHKVRCNDGDSLSAHGGPAEIHSAREQKNIRNDHATTLPVGVAAPCQLQALLIVGTRMGDGGLRAIALAISAGGFSSLTNLTVENGCVGPDGIAHIGRALSAPRCRLRKLCLVGCCRRMGHQSARAAFETLFRHAQRCDTLRELVLQRCRLHDRLMAAVAVMLQICKSLTTLDLCENRVGPNGLGLLLHALWSKNARPRQLWIRKQQPPLQPRVCRASVARAFANGLLAVVEVENGRISAGKNGEQLSVTRNGVFSVENGGTFSGLRGAGYSSGGGGREERKDGEVARNECVTNFQTLGEEEEGLWDRDDVAVLEHSEESLGLGPRASGPATSRVYL